MNNINFSEQRKQIKKKASVLAGMPMQHAVFPYIVTISIRNVKEILNQPHKHYVEKNESLLKIRNLFEDSKYHGELVRRAEEDLDSFLFETEIADEPSWIIVRKYDRGGQCFIYSISDQASLLDHLKKPKENL